MPEVIVTIEPGAEIVAVLTPDETVIFNAKNAVLAAIAEAEAFADNSATSATASEQAAVVATNKANLAAADLVTVAGHLAETNQDTLDTAADLAASQQAALDTAADLLGTNADAASTGADAIQTNLDRSATNADASATDADSDQTALDRIATSSDLIATNADAVQTALHRDATADAVLATADDVIATNADVVSTNADAVTTGDNVTATNADVVSTNADAAQTALDRAATGDDVTTTNADRAATNQDTSDTAADRVQTGLDRVATAQDKVATNADVTTTNQDALNTAADLVLTNADVVTTNNTRQAVEDIFDNFDDQYLGSYADDPTVDNDGDALVGGQLYWNSSNTELRFYNGAAWEAPSAQAATSATNALASENAAAASETQTGSDLTATNADVVTTNADAASTDADSDQTALDRVATADDVVSTNADAVSTASDAADTGNDAAATSADAAQTALDVISTGDDVTTSAANAVSASDDADAAAASAAVVADEVIYAAEWSSKDEDSLVSTEAGGDGSTDYSAKHHAAKALASAGEAAGTTLAGLDDVTINSVAAGELIFYDGTEYINRTPAEAGLTELNHTHVIADITDFTDNSGDWNIAFSWGDHDGLYSALGHTHVIADITDFTDNSANWDAAFGWGDHDGLYQPLDAILTATTASFLTADETKLDAIEALAEVNPLLISQVDAEAGTATTKQTFSALRVAQAIAALSPPMSDADVKTAYENNADTNEFSDAEQTKLDGVATGAEVNDPTTVLDSDIGVSVQTQSAILDATTASFVTTDKTKLDGIAELAEVNAELISQAESETGTSTTERTFSALRVAQAIAALSPPMSDADVKTAYENNADTNEFSDAEQTKLAGIEAEADKLPDQAGNALKVLTTDGTTATWEDTTGSELAYEVFPYTASEGQTEFAATYTVGFAEVFYNGVRLEASDFAATNGTSIVLNEGATAGDGVVVKSHKIHVAVTTIFSTDGGSANSTYTSTQQLNGGSASG